VPSREDATGPDDCAFLIPVLSCGSRMTILEGESRLNDHANNGQTEVWLVFVRSRCLCHRDSLVTYYFPIVRRVARKIHRRVPGQVDLDDLVSYGTFGLLRAIDVYDPHRGVRFETVAAAHIRGVILDELRSLDWAPRSVRRRQRELDQAVEALEAALGREPNENEIAVFLGVAEREVAVRIRETAVSKVASLEEPVLYDGTSVEPVDLAASGTFARREMADAAREALSTLPLQERAVLALHHYEGLPFPEVAQVLGVTVPKARQLHAQAALAIRNQLATQYA
jgi:RNA polymerase sigma factor for flagellar operon FliA